MGFKLTFKLTKGHLFRHAPANSSAGLEAAVIDVAQDFMLTHLAQIGVLKNLVIKGGTGLRKFYAGNAGRFSTDLDFALSDYNLQVEQVQEQLFKAINHYKNEYFAYKVTEHRGRLLIEYETDFIDTFSLSTKIDIAPTVWIKPLLMNWVSLPIHQNYGFELPIIQVINLWENMAEKIARLNRRLLARDIYDLVWIAKTSPYSSFNKDVIRNIAVLKIWTDQFGLSSNTQSWGETFNAGDYNRHRWNNVLNPKEIADEQIGLLTTPPQIAQLSQDLCQYYGFLANTTPKENNIISNKSSARKVVINEILALQNTNLKQINIW
jgi:predicted nucleotidyltransferase component of viral defense system